MLPGPTPLASGQRLDHVEVAYETYGTLDETRSNAVLICHALSGDAHVAEGPGADGSLRPGWWDPVVGPGKAIDTRKYFVVCTQRAGRLFGYDRPRFDRSRRPAGPTGAASRS